MLIKSSYFRWADMDREISVEIDAMLESIQESL